MIGSIVDVNNYVINDLGPLKLFNRTQIKLPSSLGFWPSYVRYNQMKLKPRLINVCATRDAYFH